MRRGEIEREGGVARSWGRRRLTARQGARSGAGDGAGDGQGGRVQVARAGGEGSRGARSAVMGKADREATGPTSRCQLSHFAWAYGAKPVLAYARSPGR